jgi:hypothetical protein
MRDHPIRAGKLDLDPEFASQWGIEPEDAFTMLAAPARQADALHLCSLCRGVGQSQGTTGPSVHPLASRRKTLRCGGGRLVVRTMVREGCHD